jgi:hypothetical protein
MTPKERVREIQDYYRFDVSLLESLDRLLAERGFPRPLPAIFLNSGIEMDPQNPPSFAAAFRIWLENKPDVVPDLIQELAVRIGWPEEMRLRLAGGTVNSAELWARAFAADDSADTGWAILVSEALFGFFKDVVTLTISGVLFENDQMQVGQVPVDTHTKQLSKLLGGFLETGVPSVALRPQLSEEQLGFCRTLYEAGIEFVLFHELMHAMRGHHEAARGRAVKTTLLQEAVHNHREEFEADKLGFAFLARTWTRRRAIAFAGASLLLQSLMLLERYPSYILPRRTHPPAAERLLRLRSDAPDVFLALGHKFEEVRSLEDALSHRLQLVADELPQESAPIVSPWNDLFRECADIGTSPVPEPAQLHFLSQTIRWIVMGDLQVTCATLGELWGNGEIKVDELKRLGPEADPGDVAFYSNVCGLVDRLVDWLGDQGEVSKQPLQILTNARTAAQSRALS